MLLCCHVRGWLAVKDDIVTSRGRKRVQRLQEIYQPIRVVEVNGLGAELRTKSAAGILHHFLRFLFLLNN